MKTLGYYLESWGFLILLAIGAISSYSLKINDFDVNKSFIHDFVDIGAIAFGFLLTIFGLILQGETTVIKSFMHNKSAFSQYIRLNEVCVIISFLLTIYSYIIGSGILTFNVQFTRKILVSIFHGALLSFVVYSLYFLITFYKLIKGAFYDNN